MPTLQDIQNLKLSGGQVIRDTWYEQLVDVLTEMYNDTKPLRGGYLVEDLIPNADLQLNIGSNVYKIKEIWAGYGYILYGLWGNWVKTGIATIVGDGSTRKFEIEVLHGLPTDKLAVSVSSTRPTTAPPSYIFGYLDDKDNDGFRETLVITVKFDVAPAAGEVSEVYWRAELVQ